MKNQLRIEDSKTVDQRIIENIVTDGRCYAFLPCDDPMFAKGDSLQAWMFFAELRDTLDLSKLMGDYCSRDKVSMTNFLSVSDESTTLYRATKRFSLTNGRQVEQISRHF